MFRVYGLMYSKLSSPFSFTNIFQDFLGHQNLFLKELLASHPTMISISVFFFQFVPFSVKRRMISFSLHFVFNSEVSLETDLLNNLKHHYER